MEETLLTATQFLATHGYLIIFAWVFLDQAALPVPSIPLLIAAGALVATNALDFYAVDCTNTAANHIPLRSTPPTRIVSER